MYVLECKDKLAKVKIDYDNKLSLIKNKYLKIPFYEEDINYINEINNLENENLKTPINLKNMVIENELRYVNLTIKKVKHLKNII